MKDIELILGPRIPKELLVKERKRFLMPTLLIGAAAFMLLVSIFVPYWKLTLLAPQYPGGLKMETYVNRVAGDVDEIDELNHYIGMRSLKEAAELERSLSIIMILALALLVVGSIYTHSPFALILTIPAIMYPVIFLADLYFWMQNFGMNLNPHAPLSSAVKPFVPPLLGEGLVGQFKTIATWEAGLFMSIAA
jgi:copper chaperone NosL